MSEDIKTANRVMTCCVGGWVIAVWGMGILAFSMGAPIIFSIVAFGMGCFAIYAFGSACRAKGRREGSPAVPRYSKKPTVYTGDYELHSEPTSHEKEKVYLIPKQCPSCNSTLDTEKIDWVGPLQAKCPYCGATVDAREKTL